MFTFKFASKLPNLDFHYHLSFFLAKWEIEYCRSEQWTRILPEVMQISQNEFCKRYKLEQTELEYFCLQWGKIKKTWPIYDKDGKIWFLSSTSILYELLMQQIYLRSRRGSLQELVFENFNFNINNESTFILQEAIQSIKLVFDDAQKRQLLTFITKMMSYFLAKRKGYKEIWLDLPTDPQELINLSVELEEKLQDIENDSPRTLEIYRSLRDINTKLNN